MCLCMCFESVLSVSESVYVCLVRVCVFYMSVSLCMSVGESVLYVSESVYVCW